MALLALLAAPALAIPAAAEPGAAAVDADWILSRLARPEATATAFVELRSSPMLRQPLALAGEYRRPDARTLVREVRRPYAETTTIRDGAATIERAGRAPRRFALDRAPELKALQGSFGALLAGDRAALEEHFTLSVDGAADAWTLTLAPRDARAGRGLAAIVLRGSAGELRCIESRPAQGEAQPTLLGDAAEAAADVDSLDAALRLCRGRD